MSDQTIKNGVGVIILKGNKVLLTERIGSHAANTFGSIGGHLEYGELPTDAIQRETREEIGVSLGNLKFLCCINLIKYNRHVVNLTFTAQIEHEPDIKIQEPDKIASLKWYDLTDLPSPLFKPTEIALESLKTGQKFFEINES